MDSYRNANTISVLSMLFSHVMRTCHEYAALYDSRDIDGRNEEFVYMLLIQYINQNYSTVTLKTLSEAFHYSESFLSRMIHRQAGKTFPELCRTVKWRTGKNCWNSLIFRSVSSVRLSATLHRNISAGSLKGSIRYLLRIIAKVLTFPAVMRKVLKNRRIKGAKIAYLSLHNA